MRPALDLLLLGEPGVGKTTQARKLARVFGLAPISTGQILRAAISAGEPWVEEAKADFEIDAPVRDAIVNRMVADALDQPQARRGVVFDGYPRSIAQAVELDILLKSRDRKLAMAVSFEVPHADCQARMRSRLVCENCGEIYSSHVRPTMRRGQCDFCGGTHLIREDASCVSHAKTNQETKDERDARNRAMERQRFDLMEYYHHQNLLKRIDAAKPIDAVAHDLQVVVLSVGGVPSETAVKEM